MDAQFHSELLVRSLVESNLLVREIDGFGSFDRKFLSVVGKVPELRFDQKLGHLYEDGLEWLFQISSSLELIKRSIQVYRSLETGGRATVGEFDFLLSLNGKAHHVELATKFYLGVERAEEMHWPGPDARDEWVKKRSRLVDHQLGIGKLEESKTLLKEEFGIDSYKTSHLIYGCLFHRFGTEPCEVEGIAADAHWGIWLTRSQWPEAIGEKRVWYVPKHLWPCVPSEDLVRALELSSKEKMWQETEYRCAMFTDGVKRYFLVSERWEDAVIG